MLNVESSVSVQMVDGRFPEGEKELNVVVSSDVKDMVGLRFHGDGDIYSVMAKDLRDAITNALNIGEKK